MGREAGIWIKTALFLLIIYAAVPGVHAKAADLSGNDLAVITEEYEETEYIIEDDTDEETAEAWLSPYQESLYSPAATDYLYPKLSANEKAVYAALYANAMESEKDAYVPFLSYTCTAEDKASAREQDPMSSGERMTAAYAVLFDHPEIYWSQSIWLLYSYVIRGDYYTVTVKIKFAPCAETDFVSGQSVMEERADAVIAGIDKDASEAVVALKLHDALADMVSYDHDGTGAFSHSAYGALVDGCAVCDGYAKAYKYLLGKCGIEASVVTSSNHAWNIVRQGEGFYETDVTWDDSEETKEFYNLTTAQMDDGYFHERNSAYTTKYLPRAEGGRYTSQYMSHCGKEFENAGPAGKETTLQVIHGDQDGDKWVLDILDKEGNSVRNAVYSSASGADAFTIDKELSADGGMEISRIYGIGTGTYAVITKVVYDNGASSYFKTEIEINGKVHTKSLVMTYGDMAIERGEERVFSCRIIPEDSADPVMWTSSDPETVSVDNVGKIRGVSKGAQSLLQRLGPAVHPALSQ